MPKKAKPGLDDQLRFHELAKHTEGGAVCRMTVYRWATRGILVGRRRVKLRTLRLPNRYVTTLRWYREFLAAQQTNQQAASEILAPNHATVEKQLKAELAS